MNLNWRLQPQFVLASQQLRTVLGHIRTEHNIYIIYNDNDKQLIGSPYYEGIYFELPQSRDGPLSSTTSLAKSCKVIHRPTEKKTSVISKAKQQGKFCGEPYTSAQIRRIIFVRRKTSTLQIPPILPFPSTHRVTGLSVDKVCKSSNAARERARTRVSLPIFHLYIMCVTYTYVEQ